jgi:hypothetical protein
MHRASVAGLGCLLSETQLAGASCPTNPELRSLRLRHARLDDRIFDEDHRPSPDLSVLRRLKVEKLRIKEEIERLSHPA